MEVDLDLGLLPRETSALDDPVAAASSCALVDQTVVLGAASPNSQEVMDVLEVDSHWTELAPPIPRACPWNLPFFQLDEAIRQSSRCLVKFRISILI